MRAPLLLALFALTAFAQDALSPPFTLDSGDIRWIDFTVRQTPTLVDCRYLVLSGNPTVRAELLPRSEFRLLFRGRDHSAMTATPDALRGSFRQIVSEPGRYTVVLVNEKNSPPARVSFEFKTTIHPQPGDVAQTVSPTRRLTVILVSFAVFFAIVVWSGRKLSRVFQSL